MHTLRAIAIVAVFAFQGCSTPAANGPLAATARTSSPAWPHLERFNSETEFRAYLRDVDRARARKDRLHTSKQSVSEPAEECPPEAGCLEDEALGAVIVTGSRIARAPTASPNITNVQNAAVDEGDIVKLVAGRFLVLLQDGRLFSVDTQNGMSLADRTNVYRSTGRQYSYAWYDEMLAHGNRVVVTAYSYAAQATEFSVFSLDDAGRITREGVYYISSDDYYDGDNYATRLVDGNLVIYTPIFLTEYGEGEQPDWPLVRRWVRDTPADVELSEGRPLFNARAIYRPLRDTLRPTIHTFSVCPLGQARAGDELDCRTTALVSDPGREFFVNDRYIYLWTWRAFDYDYGDEIEGACPNGAFADSVESTLYQIPLRGGQVQAMFTRGRPTDQLGMDADDREFRTLAVWGAEGCAERPDQIALRYFHTPLYNFSETPQPAVEAHYTPTPSVGAGAIENRFTATHLVYGGRDSWGSYPPAKPQAGRVVAVPLNAPRDATAMSAGHNIIRVEAIGGNAIVTGYRDQSGLSLSVVNLSATPRISSTATLANRYESEGRSHAFNSMIDENNAGLLGLPTVERTVESGRWWWRSESSDVSFLRVDATGGLRSIGPLEMHEDATHPTYSCEISCVDWYGNSRPIFIGDRVFALMGTELVEGDATGDQIAERRRLNLTTPLERAVASSK